MASSEKPSDFIPALLIVDMQEDFCPPNGSLAVQDGRSIVPLINNLITLPSFKVRIATKDFHPPSHISFASNHPPPDNVPFTSYITIKNPYNPSETYKTRLWPDHCVQGTPGSELIPELDVSHIDKVVEKGTDERVEMYSCFHDPFKNPRVTDSGLVELMKGKGVTHVYVVGLAMDYCVKFSAIDAKKAGFEVYVVREGTKAVDAKLVKEVEEELKGYDVKVVDAEGKELGWLKE